MGKTSSVEGLLAMFIQVTSHSNYKGREIMRVQITYLKLECPKDGSLKSLCISFFIKIDRLLGTTDYFTIYAKNGEATVDVMQIYMAFLCDLLQIGALIIDELQNLNRAKSGGADEMLNFFVGLSNVICIPVVLIGTYDAFDLFTNEFRQMRRGIRQGNVIWNRMQKDDEKDKSWQKLLKGIWKYQYVQKPVALTDELSEALYKVSQGVTEVAVLAFKFAQELAIMEGFETITPNIIYSAAANRMGIAHQPLEYIRENKEKELEQYRDVKIPDDLIDSYVYQETPPKTEETPPVSTVQTGKSGKQGSNAKNNQQSQPGRDEKQAADPRIVHSDTDLRQNLQEEGQRTLNTYQSVKSNGKIVDVDKLLTDDELG